MIDEKVLSVFDNSMTYFAPAERQSKKDIAKLRELISISPLVEVILEAVDGFIMILNKHRQVISTNLDVLHALELESPDCLIGLRPGEMFDCQHFLRGPGGCGTGEACKSCGAVIAMLESNKNNTPVVKECHLTMRTDGALKSAEFKVKCTPINIGGEDLTVFILHDISSAKRNEALQRVFLHDLLNTLTGIYGWLEMGSYVDTKRVFEHITKITNMITETVQEQQKIIQAEAGELVIEKRVTSAVEILSNINEVFTVYYTDLNKTIDTVFPKEDYFFKTDVTLLARVLINMVKNAFEASKKDGIVKLWFEESEKGVGFYVNNDGFIKADTALRIFERSFSTKAQKGRGLGTYSMKLFGEQYLGGEVSFDSSEKDGITFYIILPEEEIQKE